MNGGMFIGLRKEVAGALLLIVVILFAAMFFQEAGKLPGGSEVKKIEQNVLGGLNLFLVLGGLTILIALSVFFFKMFEGLQDGSV